eukprot:TRINITY_DN3174_c0_g1_i3.p1 TRINITY_DN3174_c0_g1~~TRINITY_DN3174_c0_g1_i3.p1  ORF type:complete len:204 (+),score=78.29 TRINITY_DN3174_c0_g1_i3:451-1062(+)
MSDSQIEEMCSPSGSLISLSNPNSNLSNSVASSQKKEAETEIAPKQERALPSVELPEDDLLDRMEAETQCLAEEIVKLEELVSQSPPTAPTQPLLLLDDLLGVKPKPAIPQPSSTITMKSQALKEIISSLKSSHTIQRGLIRRLRFNKQQRLQAQEEERKKNEFLFKTLQTAAMSHNAPPAPLFGQTTSNVPQTKGVNSSFYF